MAFAIVVQADSEAAKVLNMLELPLRVAFLQKLTALEPVADSARSDFYNTGYRGQEYKFKVEMDGPFAYFVVVFLFADTKDENTLIVVALGVTIV